MVDQTPGNAKAITAASAAFIAGGVSKIVLRIVAHNWPWFLDPTTSDAIDDICTSLVVGAATYFVPHTLSTGA